jgi:hypothetical protein
MESLLIFMFFASPVILVYIVLKVLQKEKWRSTQKILAGIDLNDFEVFENVQIQTSSYSHFKVISGIPHKGRLLVNNSRFIVLTEKKPSFLTYNSTLPLDINSNKKDGQYEMKICNWKAILLILKSQSSGIGFFKRELLIEPKDNNDFERLKKSIINWC